jgi:phenylpropionate dioxygenase-like ring-hydroxylating dioxygenase large terminal subunit
VKHLSYPVREQGGLIFAYMGPDQDNPPPPPKYLPLMERGGQRQVEPVRRADYNWFNFFENSADPVHVCVLHRHAGYGQQSWGDHFFSYTDMPDFEFIDTDYGMKVVMTKPGPEPGTVPRQAVAVAANQDTTGKPSITTRAITTTTAPTSSSTRWVRNATKSWRSREMN